MNRQPKRLTLTPAMVAADPELYIPAGARYHEMARRADCPHGYLLVSSCPGCDHDQEYGLASFSTDEGN
jgi:hypothetical protein